jgi:hypothetical protein
MFVQGRFEQKGPAITGRYEEVEAPTLEEALQTLESKTDKNLEFLQSVSFSIESKETGASWFFLGTPETKFS